MRGPARPLARPDGPRAVALRRHGALCPLPRGDRPGIPRQPSCPDFLGRRDPRRSPAARSTAGRPGRLGGGPRDASRRGCDPGRVPGRGSDVSGCARVCLRLGRPRPDPGLPRRGRAVARAAGIALRRGPGLGRDDRPPEGARRARGLAGHGPERGRVEAMHRLPHDRPEGRAGRRRRRWRTTEGSVASSVTARAGIT